MIGERTEKTEARVITKATARKKKGKRGKRKESGKIIVEQRTLGHAKISEDMSTLNNIDDGEISKGSIDMGSKTETNGTLVGTANVDILKLEAQNLCQ